MSDALPLPSRPNVEQYKKLAKDFQEVCKQNDMDAVRAWAARWVETLARLQGREITGEIESDIQRVQRRWYKLQKKAENPGRCTLADAQFFVARCHGFASWPKFIKHLEAAAAGGGTPVSLFETAVDAVVAGDAVKLAGLLRENPELARMRSTREHGSTLLHYVSANGVEDFRQKTPANIVEITRMLLDAGADVNAESEAYSGRSTTLGLAATSYHPQAAGVQLALMDLLIARGATIDGPDGGSAVVGCLHNGRGEAAEFFAEHGARLDLEGAAGVGRLDVVRSFFGEDGVLGPRGTVKQMTDGFAWACEFGRTAVVDFLLRHGVEVAIRVPHNGQTGLHWAALGGHADTVKLLLERGAAVDARDESFDGTPLQWALYGWGNDDRAGAAYYEVVAQLARAGASLERSWFEGEDAERQRSVRKLAADGRMQAALRGEFE